MQGLRNSLGAWRQNKSAIASARRLVETRSPVANPKSRLSRSKVNSCLAVSQAEAWQSQAPLPDQVPDPLKYLLPDVGVIWLDSTLSPQWTKWNVGMMSELSGSLKRRGGNRAIPGSAMSSPLAPVKES